jgi:hypothetical protein
MHRLAPDELVVNVQALEKGLEGLAQPEALQETLRQQSRTARNRAAS